MSNSFMRHCKNCQDTTLHIQPSTSHVLHLLLSVITFGLWIIPWFFIAQNNASQAQCSSCGAQRGLFGTTRGGKKTTATPTPDTHVKCPDCAELVRREAKVCRHCGCKLVPQ